MNELAVTPPYTNIELNPEEIQKLSEMVRSFTVFFVILVVVCCAALLAVVIALIRISISKQRQKESDEYASHIINAQEEERSRLSAELHDTVAQDLRVAVSLAKDESQKELLRACITEIRSICYELIPPDLAHERLSAAVQSLCQNFRDKNQLDVSLAILDDCESVLDSARFLDSQKLGIYRIVQESLSNIKKHAQASEVSVIIRREQKNEMSGLYISIEDDGKGFSKNSLVGGGGGGAFGQNRRHGHFGLQGMKMRASHLGGKLTVNSEKDVGTEVKLFVPLEQI